MQVAARRSQPAASRRHKAEPRRTQPGPEARKGRPRDVLSHRWHALPLAARLVTITTLLITVGLVAVSTASTYLLRTHLLSQVDEQLQSTAQAIGSQALAQMRDGSATSMPSTYYLQVQYLSGEQDALVSAGTASTYGTPVVGELRLEDVKLAEDNLILRTVGSDIPGRQWRVIILGVTDGVSGSQETPRYLGVVAIGLPLADIDETVERTRLVVAFTSLCVVLLGGLAAMFLVRRALRPLREIESVAGRIADGDLSARVPTSEPPSTEVGSVQSSLNKMLARNEHAFDVQTIAQERMTRFVSDASHELRTPLSAIRGYGELYRMGGVPAERTQEVMGRIESEASRMGRLVDDLLQLARMDQGRPMDMAPVDLREVAAAALTDMSVLAPDRECELIGLDGPETQPLVVVGDRDRLSQVLTNLLGNIVRYTPENSPVEIALGARPLRADDVDGGVQGVEAASLLADPRPRAVVEVRDHGPGVTETDAKRVFERFYRADTSRNRETGGSGLGLAIVATIVGAHGGTVRMLTTPGGGATVRMTFPLP
ncbi:sensor histidine kinase [Actinomyces weissii]|uniref:sensor histidine kinase n=1 Tax=Actinomyces weissii TaxID=675090 RepID=UPI002D7E4686|nr:HAMP domain-containing sensor histidine kinase [Actinomyces weissii]